MRPTERGVQPSLTKRTSKPQRSVSGVCSGAERVLSGMKRKAPELVAERSRIPACSASDGIRAGPSALVACALDPGVVPNADSIRAGHRQIRDLEVGAPGSSHAAGHKRDALTDHGAGRVQGLCEDTEVLCVLAVPVINVTSDSSGTVLPLTSSPFEGEVVLPAVHQSGGCHGRGLAPVPAQAAVIATIRLTKSTSRRVAMDGLFRDYG